MPNTDSNQSGPVTNRETPQHTDNRTAPPKGVGLDAAAGKNSPSPVAPQK